MTSTSPGVETEPGLGEKSAFLGGTVGAFFLGGATGLLALYLTDYLGLAATSIATVFIFAKVVDAVFDPFVGYGVDHLPRTRWGRFRPYVVVGAAGTALTLIALFTIPAASGHPLLAVWIIYPLYGLTFSLLYIPLVSFLAALSGEPKTRSQLAGIVGVTGMLAGTVLTAVTLPVVKATGGGLRGWAVFSVMAALTSMLLVLLLASRVRERVTPAAKAHYHWREIPRVFFSDRAVPILFVCKLVVQLAAGALGAALPYFFRHYMGDDSLITTGPLVIAPTTILGALGFPVLARRHGVKVHYIASLCFAVVGMTSLYVLPHTVPLVLSGFAFAAIGFGGATTLNLMLLAELTDYIEWKHGHRTEASLAAMTAFTQKAGGGLGGFFVLWVIGVNGFDGDADQQTAQALHSVLAAQSLIPAALGVVAALAFLSYPITQAVAAEAHDALLARRAARTHPTPEEAKA